MLSTPIPFFLKSDAWMADMNSSHGQHPPFPKISQPYSSSGLRLMRTKTKLKATPPKPAPPSADFKRSRPSKGMVSGPRKHSVDSSETQSNHDAFYEIMRVSLGVHKIGEHAWKTPTKTFKPGGDWVCALLNGVELFCPALLLRRATLLACGSLRANT